MNKKWVIFVIVINIIIFIVLVSLNLYDIYWKATCDKPHIFTGEINQCTWF